MGKRKTKRQKVRDILDRLYWQGYRDGASDKYIDQGKSEVSIEAALIGILGVEPAPAGGEARP